MKVWRVMVADKVWEGGRKERMRRRRRKGRSEEKKGEGEAWELMHPEARMGAVEWVERRGRRI